MIQENPIQRPSANTLIHHPCICPDATKTKAQLRKELNQEKFKNEIVKLSISNSSSYAVLCQLPERRRLVGQDQ